MLEFPSLICPTCDQFAQYYAEYDCFWCEVCQDYVSPEEESTEEINIEPPEDVDELPKEEVPSGVVENDPFSSTSDGSTEILPESENPLSLPDLESSESTDGDLSSLKQ
jgi:hypothetical protein